MRDNAVGAYDKWPNRAFDLCNKCDRTIEVRHYPESYCPFCRCSVSVRRVDELSQKYTENGTDSTVNAR